MRAYEASCLAALGVLSLVLFHRGLEAWSLLPALIGVGGIAGRWRIAPVVVILSTVALLLSESTQLLLQFFVETPLWERSSPQWVKEMQPEGLLLDNLLLCGSILAFTSAHCRLQGLHRSLLPGKQQPSKRPVAAWELALFLTAVPAWPLLALIVWQMLPADANYYLYLDAYHWRGIVLAWLLVTGALLVGGLLSYLGHRQMTVDEAALFLQDLLWHETRREQRRINRWLAWARLRRRRREERS